MDHASSTGPSSAQRGAIHSAVMAVLSVPAYGFGILAIGRMAEEEHLSEDSLGVIGLVFLIFAAWNTFGLFLGVRGIFSPQCNKPLASFAAGVHLIVLVLILVTLLST